MKVSNPPSDHHRVTPETLQALTRAIIADDVAKVTCLMRDNELEHHQTPITDNLDTNSGACAAVQLLGTTVYQNNWPDYKYTSKQGKVKTSNEGFSEGWDGACFEWILTVHQFARHV